VTAFADVVDVVAVPGDPDVVATLARRYVDTAQAMSDASSRLRALDRGASRSEAVDAFLAKADDLAERLGRVEFRYDEAGEALIEYSSALRTAIDDAAVATRARERAEDDLEAAERLRRHHQAHADTAEDGAGKDHEQVQADRQRLLADDATTEIATADRRLGTVLEDRDRAADRAIARLDVATDDGVRDAVFDDFAGWMEENDAWIESVLTVAGYVGLVLGIVALFFPLTSWLAVILLASMVVGVTGDVARAVAGTGSWADAAVSVISCLTFGIGGTALKAVAQEARVVRSARSTKLQGEGSPRDFADLWTARDWELASPGQLHKPLRDAFGDSVLAQALTYAKTEGPGSRAGDTERLRAVIDLTRALQGSDFILGMTLGNPKSSDWPLWRRVQDLTTRRVEWGTPW